MSRDLINELGLFCPTCDTVPAPVYMRDNEDLDRRRCHACGHPGRAVCVKPRTVARNLGGVTIGFIHDLTGTTGCPNQQQRDAHNAKLDQIRALNEDVRARLAESLATPPRGWVYPNGFPDEANGTGDTDRLDHPRSAAAGNTATEGDTMTTTSQPQMSGEVTGTRSAVIYARAMATAHAAHAGNEGYVTSLATMEVGEGDISKVRAAMQASKNAAAAWSEAADSIDANNARLREAYAQSPDAANKAANINE